MTRIDSTKVKWRVQVRKSRAHKWVNKGLFETRSAARTEAAEFRYERTYFHSGFCQDLCYGFGNTRVVRHVKPRNTSKAFNAIWEKAGSIGTKGKP